MADCAKPYYCYELPEYILGDACEGKEVYLGGIGAIGVVSCGITVVDPTSAAELQQLIDDGTLTVIRDIKASLDEPSVISVDPVTACGAPIPINADRTVTLNDSKVAKTIIEFYNDAIGTSGIRFGGLLLFECEESRVSYVDAAVTFFGGRNIPLLSNEPQSYNGTFSWRSPVDPIPYDAPAGIFE